MKNRFRKSKMLLLATTIAISPFATTSAFAETEMTTVNVTGVEDTSTQETEFIYTDNIDGTITIEGYIGTSKDIIIPSEIRGKVVTAIKDNSFKSISATSVEIPEGVIKIGANAFEGNIITTLVLPSTIAEIGDSAFATNSLTDVTFKGESVNFGVGVFQNNSLETIALPKDTPTLPDKLFKDNNLKGITIPGLVTRIGKETFSGNDIGSILIHSGVTGIGELAFAGNKLTSLYVPKSVTTLGVSAFSGNMLLTTTLHERFDSTKSSIFSGNTGIVFNIYSDANDPGADVPPVVTPPVTATKVGTNLIGFQLVGGELTLVKPTLSGAGFGNIKIGKESVKSSLSFTSDLIISDARGTSEGWHLTVQATPFTEVPVTGGNPPSGGWYQLPKGSLTLSSVSSIQQLDSTGNNGKPGSSFTGKTGGTATLIDDGAVTLASAKAGEGLGVWGVKFPSNAITLTVSPSTARVDKVNYPNGPTPYQSTITWTVVSGPGQ